MFKRQPMSSDLRREVLTRDDWTCVYCGFSPSRLDWFSRGHWRAEEALHIDHVFPVAKGGTNNIDNLVTACAPCNLSKGADEWLVPVARCLDCRRVFNSPEPEHVTAYYDGAIYQCPTCRQAELVRRERTRDFWDAGFDPLDDIDLEVQAWDKIAREAGY